MSAETAGDEPANELIGEARWPMAGAVLAAMVLTILFSPTDAMPLAPWAKIAMAIQSLVSLLILGLVIARAVNVFT